MTAAVKTKLSTVLSTSFAHDNAVQQLVWAELVNNLRGMGLARYQMYPDGITR